MQFIDLKAQYQRIQSQIDRNIQQVLAHGQFIMGPEVAALEQELAKLADGSQVSAVANGSEALQIALMALELKPGDEVITTPFTFIATVSMPCLLGLKPVLVDIDPHTFNIDPRLIEAKITAKTKAIIAVDLFGQPADYDAINAIAKQYNLKVIADGAQSFGARYKHRAVGTLADITSTSFYPAKPLGAYGEAGACLTTQAELAKRLNLIRNHGQQVTYDHQCLGVNARCDTLQAAILLAKLEIYEQEIALRQGIAKAYEQRLADTHIQTPVILPECQSIFAQYTVRVTQRECLQRRLQQRGIPTAIHYPRPVHLQAGFQHLGYREGDLPHAELAAKQVLSLPMHPYLTEQDLDTVCEVLLAESKVVCE